MGNKWSDLPDLISAGMVKTNGERLDKLKSDQRELREKMDEQGAQLDAQGAQLTEIAASLAGITAMLVRMPTEEFSSAAARHTGSVVKQRLGRPRQGWLRRQQGRLLLSRP